MNHNFYMQRAIQLAHEAEKKGEVPVGAVIVFNDEIIAEGFNQPISSCDPTAHAEMIALRQAAQKIKNYRLLNTTLYITLEPCVMCAAALIHARVKRIVFGAYDPKSVGQVVLKSVLTEKLNHQIEYVGGILEEQCGLLLKKFFQAKR